MDESGWPYLNPLINLNINKSHSVPTDMPHRYPESHQVFQLMTNFHELWRREEHAEQHKEDAQARYIIWKILQNNDLIFFEKQIQ